MGYIDKNLLADEKILLRTKKSLIIFTAPILWTLGAAFCYFFPSNVYLNYLAFLPALAAVFFWINQFIHYSSSDFVITTKRILMREGFFYRHTNDTRLAIIANVTVTQSLLAQLLNYGSVVINTFGGDSDPFSEINNPFLFQKTLQEQLDKLTPPPRKTN